MHKVRVHEIAKELGIKSKEVIEKSKEIDIELKASQSAVTQDVAQTIMQYILNGVSPQNMKREKMESKKEIPKEDLTPKETKEQEDSSNRKNQKPKPDKRSKESLAESSIARRRVGGLRIVKKKKPVVKESIPVQKIESKKEQDSSKKDSNSLAELFKNRDIKDKSFEDRPKRVKKKKIPAQKKSSLATKIDIDRELKDDLTIEEPQEEVVLMDFSLNEKEEKKEEPKKKLDENSIKVTRKSSFLNQQGIRRSSKKRKRAKQVVKQEDIKSVEIPENVRVYEFAEKINKSVGEIITVLFKLGMIVNKNDFLDSDHIEILADEFDIEVTTTNPLDKMDYVDAYNSIEDDSENLEIRPPVITIMGHVDHGKTSLLDKIRNARVAKGEAGGITQHIGAYIIDKDGKKITFIDTPGHSAFTEMRARGASLTDIVIIVVAADDGVKPQTLEAISHAKAADVPIIVAINKIDKPDANLDLVKSQMAENGITSIDWGGEYEFIPVSAHSGEGIDELLDTINIQAELMELKANPKRNAKAVVVESTIKKGQGASATIVVQNGTLKIGDSFVVDTTYGRVRAINNDLGKRVQELKPGEPGSLIGFNEVPSAGSILVVKDSEKDARDYATSRAEYFRQKELSKSTKASFDELSELIAEGKIKTLPIILKADVQGSIEAIKGSLEKLKNEEVKINIIHSAVGAISESDLTLANASENSIVLGFNVRPSASVKNRAKELGVEVKTYSIIYDLIDDVKSLLSGLMSPVVSEEVTGQAEVRDTFSISKVGTIAGCMVTDGLVTRNSEVRLIRDGVVIYTSKINSLKRFKDDAKEVNKGYECGIMIENFNDIKVGDIFETFKQVEEQAEL